DLRVIQAIGSHFVQFRKALALDAKALVVGKVQVHNIHLHRSHSIHVALEHVERNEVTADVNEQAAPGEPGLVFYGDGRHGEAGRSDFDELEESLQSMQNAQGRWRVELGSGIGNCQLIRL